MKNSLMMDKYNIYGIVFFINNDLDQKEVNILLTKLQTLSSNKQLSRIQNQTIRQNDTKKL